MIERSSPRARLRQEGPYLTLRTAAERTNPTKPKALAPRFVLPSRRPKPARLRAIWETA